jgi:hypothetical protein
MMPPRSVGIAYENGWNRSVNDNPDASESVHAAAGEAAMEAGGRLWKAEPIGGLRKYLTNEPAKPRMPRAPKIGGAAAKPSSHQQSYLRQEAHPARALGQVGSYGLGQAGWASAHFLSHAVLPSGGTIPKIARFGMESLGALSAGTAG